MAVVIQVMPQPKTPDFLPDADPEQLQAILNGYETYLSRSLTKVESDKLDPLLFKIIEAVLPDATETLKASYFVRIKAIGLMVIRFQDELKESGHIRIHPNGFDAGVGIHKSLFRLIAHYEIPLTQTGKTDASIDVNLDHLFQLAQASIPFRPKRVH